MELRLSIALVPLMIAAVGCGDDGPSAPPVGGRVVWPVGRHGRLGR